MAAPGGLRALLLVLVVGAAAEAPPASIFLEPRDSSEDQVTAAAAAEEATKLLQGLGTSFGEAFRRKTAARAKSVETDLHFTFAAMPKNPEGRLSAPAARYLLHRVLRRRRGWLFNGVDPAGGAWSTGSPMKAFVGVVPEDYQRRLEKLQSQRGLSLREVSVVAATLEGLAHMDALRRVKAARAAMGTAPDGPGRASEVQWSLQTFVRSFMLGPRNASRMSPKIVQKLQTYNMTQMYPAWPSAMDFVSEIRQAWVPDPSATRGGILGPKYPYKAVEKVVEDVSDRFGQWQDRECKNLKQQLLALEDPSCPGHVRLSRFYGSALSRGKWQFTESPAYLRDSGSLQELDAQDPSVLVANYMAGPSNCLATTGFYTLCCYDECDGLLVSLEAQFAGPDATQEEIVKAVQLLPSSSEPVREKLPAHLLEHLKAIAEVHGGRVPLHGRLFQQWMHHAYPRECPYPHPANTTRPLRPLDWKRATGQDIEATQGEMQTDVARGRPAGAAQKAQLRQLAAVGVGASQNAQGAGQPACSAWTMQEELVVPVSAGAEAKAAAATPGAPNAPVGAAANEGVGTLDFPIFIPASIMGVVTVLIVFRLGTPKGKLPGEPSVPLTALS